MPRRTHARWRAAAGGADGAARQVGGGVGGEAAGGEGRIGTRPPNRAPSSHIAVPALDGLADHRRRDLIGDLDIPDFAVALRGEISEQLRDHRHIAYLLAAQAAAARDVL